METAVKTLDVRKVSPFERPNLLFPAISALAAGETLEIINDHDPSHLSMLLESQSPGQYQVMTTEYPDRWVAHITKTMHETDKKQQVKDLIKELHGGGDPAKLKEKGKDILNSISHTDIALIEQELIREGTTVDEIRKLCDVHLEMMRDSIVKNRIEVHAPHPIHTLMEEHQVILGNLKKLKELTETFKSKKNFKRLETELAELKEVSHELIEAEKHHQREEDVIFPAIEKQGVVEPPEIMRQEHVEFRRRKEALYKLAQNAETLSYEEFIAKLTDHGLFIAKELDSHIYKEDNILYQLALQVVPKGEWDEIKRRCDEIGYCCFTPQG
ncbi:MAG: DUF438 domain-containing protein [Firmicutes bacterium]|nr:DUF438 domain-containing protein [Bacillota bacterium]